MVSGPEHSKSEYKGPYYYQSIRIDKTTVALESRVSREQYYEIYNAYTEYNEKL